MQHTPSSTNNTTTILTRFVPAAFYIHKKDLDFQDFWISYKEQIVSHLKFIDNSPEGDLYENVYTRYSTFEINKRSGVIILGKDTDPYLEELMRVRDYLIEKGYNANLIKKLPEIQSMS